MTGAASPSRLLCEARIYTSLYACFVTGTATGLEPLTVQECTRRSGRLFRELLRRACGQGDSAGRLRLLSAAYDLLNGTTTVSDPVRSDRWYAVAEKVMAPCFAEASGDGLVRTGLCRCLSDYFYLASSPESDDWYLYLQDTADAWACAFIPGTGWRDCPLGETLERIDVMNRLSYMFLYHVHDRLIGEAFRLAGSRLHSLPTVPVGIWERWFHLSLEGNACPFDREEAGRALAALSRLAALSPDGDLSCMERSCRFEWDNLTRLSLPEAS